MALEMENKEFEKSLEDLYLNEDLQELSTELGRTIVTAGYVCDFDNDAIATKTEGGAYKGLKNDLDWGVFQRLIAHADAIITGSDYLKRVKNMGLEKAQNVLNQFSKGGAFESLGDWRESKGIKRNPDILVVTRNLDVYVPSGILENGRKIIVFTTHRSSISDEAKDLRRKGVSVIDTGNSDDSGVDGDKMFSYMNEIEHFKVAKVVTGPRVLDVLRKQLDILYVDRVHKNIPGDRSEMITILVNGDKLENCKDLEKIRTVVAKKVTLQEGDTADIDFETYISTRFDNKERNQFLRHIKSF